MPIDSLALEPILLTEFSVNTKNTDEPILMVDPNAETFSAYLLNSNNTITTNVLIKSGLDGCFSGQINLNDTNTPYSGTIRVYDSNTRVQLTEVQSDENGLFKISDLNKELQYDVECIPSESTKYQAKRLKNTTPNIDESINPSITVLSESAYIHDQYNCIIKVDNIQGNATILLSLPFLQVENIRDDIYKIYGVPESGIFEYNINVTDIRTNSTIFVDKLVSVNIPINVIDIDFNNHRTSIYNSVTVNSIGNPTYVPYGDSTGLKVESSANTITINSSSIFNIYGNDDFEIIVDFKLKSKRTSDKLYACLFSSNGGVTLPTNNHIAFEFVKHGIKFKRYNGENDHYSNSFYADYNFEQNKSYVLKIKRNQFDTRIFINNELVIQSTIYQGIPLDFSLGGKLNIGFCNWSETTGSVIELKRFRFTKGTNDNILIQKYYPDVVQSKTNIIYFDSLSSTIYDNLNNQYDANYFIAGSYGYSKKPNNKIMIIREFESFIDFTIEVKGNFTGTNKQYILYNNDIKIWFDGISFNISFDGNQYSAISTEGNKTVQFKKLNSELNIFINGILISTYSLPKYNYPISFNQSFIMSDITGENHCTSEIEYIFLNNTALESNSLGNTLILQNENLDFCYNETVDYQLKNPYGSFGNCTWELLSGSLPTGLSLTSIGRIIGTPTNENTFYSYKLKCTDSKGSIGIKNYNSNVGTIVSLTHFEGTSGATTMSDSAGKVWTSVSAAPLSNVQKKFGYTSGLFNGTNQCWTTPNSTDFDLKLNDFTISVWVYNQGAHSATYRGILSKRNSSGTSSQSFTLLRYNNTRNQYTFEVANGTSTNGSSFGDVITLNRWDFVTVSRRGAYLYCGVNGKVDRFYFGSEILTTNITPKIGQLDSSSGSNFQGYIDELKVVQGSALYTTDFVPPTKPSDFPSNVLIGSVNNLVVTSSNNKITVTWDHDEYPTTFKYYRSTTTMNPVSMPDAINANVVGQFDTRRYTDSDQTLVAGTTYYIRIGSVKNGVEKISNEIGVVVVGFTAPYNLTVEYIA